MIRNSSTAIVARPFEVIVAPSQLARYWPGVIESSGSRPPARRCFGLTAALLPATIFKLDLPGGVRYFGAAQIPPSAACTKRGCTRCEGPVVLPRRAFLLSGVLKIAI